MKELVYPREKTLGTITLVLGLLFWLLLIVGTVGIALLGLLFGFIIYLFAQSALIAHIKGNGVELTANQYPELYAQFSDCCARLKISTQPRAYVLNGNGWMNAFATQFLGAQYVVLLSNVVDAMAQHPDGVRFYIGHELGHLRMKHLSGHLLRWPVLWLPLIGAAYARAKESTCDRHGLACSNAPENAGRALAALATGEERWKDLDLQVYHRQTRETGGFWMSFHELIAGYPWLSKRVARVTDQESDLPSRNGLSYIFALVVPYAGRLGGGFGLIVIVYIIGVLAAIAVPQYNTYTIKAKLTAAYQLSQPARLALTEHYLSTHQIPADLIQIGIAPQLSDGSQMRLNPKNMQLTVHTPRGELIFSPSADSEGKIIWSCANGADTKPSQLPAACHE